MDKARDLPLAWGPRAFQKEGTTWPSLGGRAPGPEAPSGAGGSCWSCRKSPPSYAFSRNFLLHAPAEPQVRAALQLALSLGGP